MKRSEINQLIKKAEVFFELMHFNLPVWAHWEPQQWKGKRDVCQEIADNMLGWDLTDFGKGRFFEKGLLLFTIRNGNLAKDRKTYAEKIMIAREGQITPMHFHFSKMEDIINRGGGKLIIRLYGSTEEETLSEKSITVKIDGIKKIIPPGETVSLSPGESICLEQGMYHEFFAESGSGDVLIGEVSSVNDDLTDNRFLEPMGRFPSIEEDEPPYRLLVSDYPHFL